MPALVFVPLLALHILAGLAALTAGLVAMASRKRRGALHGRAGHAFVLSMTAMALSAAVLTIAEPDRLSLGAALWTIHLVLTSRSAAASPNGSTWRADRWALAMGLLAALALGHGGWEAAQRQDGAFQGASAAAYAVFGSGVLLTLVLDAWSYMRGRLPPRQRIARHLWRMTLAYFLAATSLFLGQQDDVFPFMQGSPVLLLPSALTLAYLVWWLAKVRFARHWLGAAPRPAAMFPRKEEAFP